MEKEKVECTVCEAHQKKDERIRKEFSKAFGWYEDKNSYNYQKELKIPTWEEVFVKLGRLLKVSDSKNTEDLIAQLNDRIFQLENPACNK